MTSLMVEGIFTAAAVVFHASIEWADRQNEYFGRATGFTPPRWFPVLAVVNLLLIPLAIGALWDSSAAASYAAGGLVGDVLSNHALPTWFAGLGKWPATDTWWLYLLCAMLLAVSGGPISLLAFGLGAASFALLWPALYAMK